MGSRFKRIDRKRRGSLDIVIAHGKGESFFTEKNKFGVIDHDVVLGNGKRFHNPLRVLENKNGSEVVFTLFRQPEMTDSDFNRDAGMVLSDLKKLKKIIEENASNK